MRILTVRQPWAWAIIHGGKDVENRVRSLGPFRGLVAIHVAQADAESAPTDLWREHANFYRSRVPGDQPLNSVRGAVVGVVDLVGTHLGGVTGCHPDQSDPHRLAWCSPWAMLDHHHLELANPRALPKPIPAKGRLGLWRPDADLEAAIRGQIGGA